MRTSLSLGRPANAARRSILVSFLFVAGTLFLAACEEVPTEADPQGSANEAALFKKGGGGKPGGGGNATAPDPVIAFSLHGTLWVMNEDGSNLTEVFSGWEVLIPSWAPGGNGTKSQPYRVVLEDRSAGCCSISTMNVDTVGGTVNATEPQTVPGLGFAGAPSWGPAGEIAYEGLFLNPSTDVWHDAIYVISDPALPDPMTPTPVYVAPVGRGPFLPAWSPSGDAIAFVERNEVNEHAIQIVDRETGDATTVLEFGEFYGLNGGIDWSKTLSNPSFLAFASDEENAPRGSTRQIHKLQLTADADGTYHQGQLSLLTTGFLFPTWSADDTRLLASDRKSLKTVDAATGSLVSTLTRNGGDFSDWRR